ncbi:MAG: FtsH protease activity modulator HflK [Planctomycetota bacterium]
MRDARDIEFRPEPGKIALVGVGIILLVVVVLGVAGSFYSVQAESQAVVLRFGRRHTTTGPGLHGKLPFGIDTVYEVPVGRLQTMEFGFTQTSAGVRSEYRVTAEDREQALMLTGRRNMASVEWIVKYRIDDPLKYLFSVADVKSAIAEVSEAVMRTLVGDRSVDEVITIGRVELEQEAAAEMQRILWATPEATAADPNAKSVYDCGVRIDSVQLQDVTYPEQVKAAFEAVNNAQQKKETTVNEAKAERNRLLPAALGQKEKKISEAEGYKLEKVSSATGRAQALLDQYAEYEKRPRETRLRLFMETMEVVFTKAGRKIIIDPDVKGVLPLLDLGAESKGGAR